MSPNLRSPLGDDKSEKKIASSQGTEGFANQSTLQLPPMGSVEPYRGDNSAQATESTTTLNSSQMEAMSEAFSTPALTKSAILKALQEVSDRLGSLGERGRILLVGGAAMVLIFQSREGTKDVDAVLEPKEVIRRIAHRMAQDDPTLRDGWLNNSAEGFLTASERCTYTMEQKS